MKVILKCVFLLKQTYEWCGYLRAGWFDYQLYTSQNIRKQYLSHVQAVFPELWLLAPAKYLHSQCSPLDETDIYGCLHFSMQNFEMSCDLDHTFRWRKV